MLRILVPHAGRLHQMVRRHGNAPCRLGGIGVTARVASLTNYRRVDVFFFVRLGGHGARVLGHSLLTYPVVK